MSQNKIIVTRSDIVRMGNCVRVSVNKVEIGIFHNTFQAELFAEMYCNNTFQDDTIFNVIISVDYVEGIWK